MKNALLKSRVLGFVLLSWSSTWKSSISGFFSWCWCCDRGDVAMSVLLGLLKWRLSISHSHFLPPSIFYLTAVCCSCLSLSVSLPQFWHLHAVKDRREKKQALVVSPKTKSTLSWSVKQLENDWWTFCISAGLRRWRRFKRSRSHVRKDEK